MQKNIFILTISTIFLIVFLGCEKSTCDISCIKGHYICKEDGCEQASESEIADSKAEYSELYVSFK